MAVKRTCTRRRNQSGFSLLEMMLTVGVAAIFFVFVIEMGQNLARDQASRAAANYVAQIDKAIENMLKDPARFNVVYDAVENAPTPGMLQASVDDLVTGAGVLPASPLLPSTFPNIGPYGQTYRILMRITDDMSIATDDPTMEILVASQTMVDDDTAMQIANYIGGHGGALRDANLASAANIRGVYGTWSVPMSTLASTAWYGTVTGNPLSPTTRNGGYVVSYHFYDFKRLARDYLYRNDLGDDELNTMHSDMKLSHYNILGADDVTSSGVLTTNEMVVQSSNALSPLQNTTRIQGVTTVRGNLQADGPSIMDTIIDTTTAGRLSSPRGTITVGGNNTGGIIDVGGAVYNTNINTGTFSGVTGPSSSMSGPVTAENAAISNGTIDARGTAQGIRATPPTGLTVTGATSIAQDLKTSTLNSGTINVGSGNVASVYLNTTGGYTQNAGGTIAINNRLSVGGRARTTAFGTCDNGC